MQQTAMNSGLDGNGAPIEEIPDILTGEIWKGNQKNADKKKKPQDGGETGYGQENLATTYNNKVSAQCVNPYSTTSIVKPEITKY